MNDIGRIKLEQKEINILEVLQDGEEISQRDIANRTGMSLGMVNILLNKCIKKGLVKIEHLNSRSVRYILTPKGIQEKTAKTIEYIKKSYKAILRLSAYIKELTEEQVRSGKKICLLGKPDEMFQLVSAVLAGMGVIYNTVDSLNDLVIEENTVVYLWDPSFEIEMNNIAYINIFVKGKL